MKIRADGAIILKKKNQNHENELREFPNRF